MSNTITGQMWTKARPYRPYSVTFDVTGHVEAAGARFDVGTVTVSEQRSGVLVGTFRDVPEVARRSVARVIAEAWEHAEAICVRSVAP